MSQIEKTIHSARARAALALALSFAIAAATGCGGGGGGGGASPTPTPSSAPTQSNWSPAKNGFSNSGSFNLTFNTNASASCRWALTDSAYSAMSSNCSGSGTTSQSCAVSGLTDGSRVVYLACSGSSGAADTAATNTHVPLIIDTVPPTIQITAPDNGSSWFTSTPPTVVSVSYSDDRSGANPAELEVNFTLMGRKLSITDLFGRDATANATTSRTDAANSNPLYRTSVTRFDSTDFDPPDRVWTIDRCGGGSNLRASVTGSDFPVLFWDSLCSAIWMVPAADAEALKVAAPGGVVAAAAAPERNLIFAAISGSTTLRIYNAATGAAAGTVALPDEPTALSYNPANSRLYIAYDSRLEIGVYSLASGALLSPIPVGATPIHLRAWPTTAGDVMYTAWDVVYRLFRVGAAGAELAAADIGPQTPRGLAIAVASNKAFAPRRAEGDVRSVNVSTGAASTIPTGSLPSAIFDADGEVIVINAGDETASVINAATGAVTRTSALSAPVSSGARAGGRNFLVEDLWQISPSAELVIEASIRDRAGNLSSASISITVRPETPGAGREAIAKTSPRKTR